jgi:superfamily II DNA or RNA helicase
MSYFSDNYSNLRLPFKEGDAPGFRTAQLGAIHAAGAHFSLRTEPGIITMPTGSGKTAVLIAAAFILRANRVLIVTPSRLVREQIAEEVATLTTLKEVGAFDANVPSPTVFSTKKRITSAAEWESMRDFDVVVGTVQSISPEYAEIPEPPKDLFDLVLVDEAHHSPARTWQRILSHFPDAKRLLFTATPFRQDQREVKGRFILTYDLGQAFKDGIFGEIAYQPVIPAQNENHDVAIAKAAERQFNADRAAGYQHRVMVRTDTRSRATALVEVYRRNTNLRLALITGHNSLRYVKGVIRQLDAGELDGIICVNMLGEGFNFPSLKIAAIHAPHRSLNVTLQFIGRFARTAGRNLGRATFLAIPSEIEIEAERLYDTRAVWQDIVQNLSAARVYQEAQTREVLDSFAAPTIAAEELADLSLYVLEPYYHVKVYQLDEEIDITRRVEFPPLMQVVYEGISEAHNASVYITREITLPRWTSDDRLSAVDHDLFIFYQDRTTNLLFVCASVRSPGLYDHLSRSFEHANPRPLPLARLNRALNDLDAPEFFNVGMRNRVAANTTESYRIITGSNADKAILKSDGRLYHRGHVFGRASDRGESVTIGLSSASKIWSNKSSKLPELIEWCAELAKKIQSGRMSATGSGLDYLDVGEELTELPDNVVGVDWPQTVYQRPPVVRFIDQGEERNVQLLDLELSIDLDRSTKQATSILLRGDGTPEFRFTFSYETNRLFEPTSRAVAQAVVEHDRETMPLIDFLNSQPLWLYTADLSLIQEFNIFRPPPDDAPALEPKFLETVDWTASQVDIRREFGLAERGMISVHAYLEDLLRNSDNAIVYYDHGTGEIADFVGFEEARGRLIVRLFHCKGSSQAAPGHRLGDIYEIAGQVVKSTKWARKQRVLSHIRRRFNENIGSHTFVKGNLDGLSALLEEATPALIDFEFIAVQPGLRRGDLPAEFTHILASASDYLVRGGFRPLRIVCAA